jgi:hypothetical protein
MQDRRRRHAVDEQRVARPGQEREAGREPRVLPIDFEPTGDGLAGRIEPGADKLAREQREARGLGPPTDAQAGPAVALGPREIENRLGQSDAVSYDRR